MADAPDDPSLAELAAHLVHHPSATMQELAIAVGSSRSTLHRRFPRRDDLIEAIASQALSALERVWAEQHSEGWFTDPAVDAVDTLTGYVTDLIELGPQLLYIVRASALLPAIPPELAAMDAELEDAMRRGQRAGALDPALPAVWLAESLHALVYTAWDQVAAGRLAARDAARSVITAWAHGVTPPRP